MFKARRLSNGSSRLLHLRRLPPLHASLTWKIEAFPRDLHLGCGGRRAPGFCNVDITSQDTVDVCDNVVRLERFPDNYASSIYACHVLEHFSPAQAPEVLKTLFRALQPGGTIRISVPDIDRIVKIYVKNWDHFQKDSHSPWIGLLHGGADRRI